MAKKPIKELIEEVLEPFLKENGYELYNVEFVKEVKDWFLRVYIDRDTQEVFQENPFHTTDSETKLNLGIGTDDCEKVSRFLSAKLDELDPIEQNYYLEVSSPGMDRVLLREKDFKRFAGSMVTLQLYKALDGKKTLTGKLIGLEEDKIIISDEEGNVIKVDFKMAAKTKLAVIF